MGELWQQAMNKMTMLMSKNMNDKENTKCVDDQRAWWGEVLREERELYVTADCLK